MEEQGLGLVNRKGLSHAQEERCLGTHRERWREMPHPSLGLPAQQEGGSASWVWVAGLQGTGNQAPKGYALLVYSVLFLLNDVKLKTLSGISSLAFDRLAHQENYNGKNCWHKP